MDIFYILSVLAFDSFVMVFSVLFGAIPGKWYKWRIEPIQLFFSIVSCGVGVASCIWTKINEEQLILVNSLYSFSFQMIFTVLYLTVFVASLCRFNTYLKAKKGVTNEYIKLKGSEYELTSELKNNLGNLVYMPNVKAYATSKDFVILFSGMRPNKEIDAGFICKKIGEKTYDCISFVDLRSTYSLKNFINDLINCLIICVALMFPVLLAYMDKVFIITGNVDNMYNIFKFLVMFLLGSLGTKLFLKTKGFGRVLYYIFLLITIASFYYLISFFR